MFHLVRFCGDKSIFESLGARFSTEVLWCTWALNEASWRDFLFYFYVPGISRNLGRGSPHSGPFQAPGINSSMFQEFLEIWAEVSLNPDHSRSGFVPYKYRVICPSAGLGRFRARRPVLLSPSARFMSPTARFIEPCIKG